MAEYDPSTGTVTAQAGTDAQTTAWDDLWAERKDLNPYCFGCGRDNTLGLSLRPRAHGERVAAEWTPAPHFSGYQNLCHGGIVAAVLDEMMGWMIIHAGEPPHATIKLDVEYRAPVWLGRSYRTTAWIEERRARILKLAAEIVADGGAVVVRGRAVFARLDAEKAAAFMGGGTDPGA